MYTSPKLVMNLVRGPLSAKLSLYTAALMHHGFGLMLLAADSFYNKADLKITELSVSSLRQYGSIISLANYCVL